MKTLTAAQARSNLSAYLSRALKGEDIGIVCEGKIVALRPVAVYSEDYALQEYGLEPEAMARVGKKLAKKAHEEKARRWDGSAKGLRG